MSNLSEFLTYKSTPKVKVGDMIGFPADKPNRFAICTTISKSSSGYLVVNGRWGRTIEEAELANGGQIFVSRDYYRLRDVCIIKDYIRKPYPECGSCLGCEKVKQPSDCRFNCHQKDKMIKTLLEIK